MKLTSITIKGFRCWKDVTIYMEDYTCLIGRNDAGKSAALRAIAFLFDPERSWSDTDSCKIEGFSEADPQYVEAMLTGLPTSHPLSSTGILRLRRYNNNRYYYDGKVPDNEYVRKLSEGITKADYRTGVTQESELWTIIPEILRNKQKWGDADRKQVFEILSGAKIIVYVDGEEQVPNDKIAKHFSCYMLEADAKASEEASAKQSSIYGSLANQVITSALNSDDTLRSHFNAYKERLVELTGLDDSDNPKMKELNDVADKLNSYVIEFNGGISAKIVQSSPDIQYPKLTNNLVIQDQWSSGISQFGHGLQRTVVLSLLRLACEQNIASIGADSHYSILIIEEPELYLHPQAERERMKLLEAIANSTNTSLILATHSAFFVDIVKYRGLKLVKRQGDGSSGVHECKSDLRLEDGDQETIKLIKSLNPTASAMFFADQIVLAEGQTEEICIPLIAELLGFNTRDLEVVDCHGASFIPSIQLILEAFGVTYVALFDWDKSKDEARKGYKIAEGGSGRVVLSNTNWEAIADLGNPGDHKPSYYYKKYKIENVKITDELKKVVTAAVNQETYIPEGTISKTEARPKNAMDRNLCDLGIN